MKEFDIDNYQQITQISDKINEEWTVLRFKAHTLYLHLQAIAATDLKFDVNHKQIIELQEGKTVWAGYRRSELKSVAEQIINKTKQDPTWIDRYASEFWNLTNKFKVMAEQFYLDTPSNELVEQLVELINHSLAPQRLGYVTICTNIPNDFWVEEYLKTLDSTLTDSMIITLLSPNRPSFLARFHDACKQKSDKEVMKEFFFVKASYWKQEKLKAEDLIHETTVQIKKPSMKKEVAEFVHVMEELIAMQDERKANALRICMCLHKMAVYLSEQSNYKLDELENMTIHEFLCAIKGESNDIKKIRNRKNCLWVFKQKKYFSTQQVDEAKKILQNTGSLKGRIACKGCVRGPVKIVLNEDDFSKLREGDVLVTSMTRPEFLPVMKKAVAFVTAEGGITCHAAIIAREMKKPCITSVAGALDLKDGEIIEVDANNGVVRKVNE